MSEQLWLRQPRRVVQERGFGIAHVPGDVRATLHGTFEIDPLTGYACCPVAYELRGVYDWQTNDDPTWVTSEPFLALDGSYHAAVCHRAPAAFSLSTTAKLPAGQGFMFGFIAYGNGSPFDLFCGPGWRLRFENGLVSLFTTDPLVPAAQGQLWSPEEWEATLHYLYVYGVGNRLCARRIGLAGETAAGGTVEGLLAPVPVGTSTPLPAAKLTVRGRGYLTFGAAPARHGRSLVVQHRLLRLPEPLSQVPAIAATVLNPPAGGAVSEVFDAAGDLMSDAEPPFAGFVYRVTASLSRETGPNVYLTRVRVVFPPLVAEDGQESVDLMALAPAGIGGEPGTVQAVELRRGLDPESAGLTIELGTAIDQVAPYVQPHMKGQWVVDGASQAVFYTSRPSLTPALYHERLRLDCELGWKLLKAARCGGDLQLAGQRLAAAYRAVARRAGLADDEIVTAGTYRLPVEEPDGEPQFDIRPEMTLAEVMTYLREQFASGDRIHFDDDGVLRVGPQPTAASGVVFATGATEQEELPSVAAGAPPVPRIREGSWSEDFEEGGFANEVAVVGEDRELRPLVAVATDWPSIRGHGEGEVPFNYVAEFRRMVIIDGALTSQALVNWVARTVLQRVRLLRLRARFESSYVAVTPGDIVEVEGRGLWRLMGLTRRSDGPWADRATYEVEQELG